MSSDVDVWVDISGGVLKRDAGLGLCWVSSIFRSSSPLLLGVEKNQIPCPRGCKPLGDTFRITPYMPLVSLLN